jgi:hypothetical protein
MSTLKSSFQVEKFRNYLKESVTSYINILFDMVRVGVMDYANRIPNILKGNFPPTLML